MSCGVSSDAHAVSHHVARPVGQGVESRALHAGWSNDRSNSMPVGDKVRSAALPDRPDISPPPPRTPASWLKANSHRLARRDKTVLSVSRPFRRCELDSRQLKTVADRKFEGRAIVQFTPDTTQTRPSCRVWCGGVNSALEL